METLNEWFNRSVDIALIVATRLAEMPFVVIMLVLIIGVTLVHAA